MCMCVPVSGDVHVRVGARGGQKRVLDPLELGFQAVVTLENFYYRWVVRSHLQHKGSDAIVPH